MDAELRMAETRSSIVIPISGITYSSTNSSMVTTVLDLVLLIKLDGLALSHTISYRAVSLAAFLVPHALLVVSHATTLTSISKPRPKLAIVPHTHPTLRRTVRFLHQTSILLKTSRLTHSRMSNLYSCHTHTHTTCIELVLLFVISRICCVNHRHLPGIHTLHQTT